MLGGGKVESLGWYAAKIFFIEPINLRRVYLTTQYLCYDIALFKAITAVSKSLRSTKN
jgi:hypothetical protein